MLQKLPSVWGKYQDSEDQVYASGKKQNKTKQIAALTKQTRVFSEFSGLCPFSSLLEVSIQLSMSL